MLYEFLTSNRNELIRRCRTKVAKRYQPLGIPSAVDRGAPLFLQQLTDILRREQITAVRDTSPPESTPEYSEIGKAAALLGAEMLRLGFSVDQVVHEYGDVCQSVTDMAVEQKVPIAADQFRTLNRCLDDAIADAVSAIRTGNVGTTGETCTLLLRAQGKSRTLTEQSLPTIHFAAGNTKVARH